MVEFVEPEDLRRPSTHGHQDLLAWRFRDRWLHDDTSTVLAWPNDHGCVFHEANCRHSSSTEEPTAMCRMDQVRAVFAVEQPKSTYRYFGFCGHCLTERIANYGWKPSEHDFALLETMRRLLTDVRVRGEQPISQIELIARMKRYPSGPLTKPELKRLIDYYRHQRGDEEDDATAYVIT